MSETLEQQIEAARKKKDALKLEMDRLAEPWEAPLVTYQDALAEFYDLRAESYEQATLDTPSAPE